MLIVVVNVVLVGLPDYVTLELFLIRCILFTMSLCDESQLKISDCMHE